MTTTTVTRPPTEADIRAEVQRAMSGEEYQDIRDGIAMVASIIRDPGWTILESPDPREPGEDRGLWADLRPTEGRALVDLVNAAEERIRDRVQAVILEELTAAGVAFAVEYPDAPRAREDAA